MTRMTRLTCSFFLRKQREIRLWVWQVKNPIPVHSLICKNIKSHIFPLLSNSFPHGMTYHRTCKKISNLEKIVLLFPSLSYATEWWRLYWFPGGEVTRKGKKVERETTKFKFGLGDVSYFQGKKQHKNPRHKDNDSYACAIHSCIPTRGENWKNGSNQQQQQK